MRGGVPSRENLLFVLTLIVVSVTLVLPGETWFQSRALCQLLIFAGFGLWILQQPKAAGRSAVVVLLFLLLFFPAMLFTPCPGRSVETLTLWLSYFCLFLLIRGLRPSPRRCESAQALLCGMTVLLLLYAVYQYVTGFGGLAAAVAAESALSEGQRADMLSRLASRRVFSTYPLPTTFALLVVMMLPLLFHRFTTARHGGRRPAVVGWGAALLLALGVLPLTGSFGVVPVLGVMGLTALLAGAHGWSPRQRAAMAALALVGVAVVFLVVLEVRGFTPWASEQAHNPVSQRLFNWRSACSIWLEHPLTGAGPGNFGVAYARHRLPGANETVVAHNSYLHLAAESGLLPGAALIIVVSLLGWRLGRRLLGAPGEGEGGARALGYALLALLLYACFEITAEFPGIGYPGVFIAALASLSLFPPQEREPGARSAIGGLIVGLVLVAGFAWSVAWYGGQLELERAVALAAGDPGERQESLVAAEAAAAWNPLDPEPWAVRGVVMLAAGRAEQDRDLIRRAGDAYLTASALDPERAFFHDRLSHVHQTLGRDLAAFLAADRAAALYPSESRYRERRQALLPVRGGGP